ncbi:MAG: VTT domain-containing protein [Deltaproteobacteria bacterium]|nr:VTT domain-containing protein [Deltaproteobacteria bacterium]
MDWLGSAIDIFLHLDRHLNTWAGMLGPWLYAVLFLIIFCETGLVVTPYSEGSPIQVHWVLVLLSIAAIIGDAANYTAGRWLGPKVFSREDSWLLNKQYLDRAHRFYEKYGGKTIVIARFVPIVRTFAPFVAGIGRMDYPRFAFYNVAGGIAWTSSFLLAGYGFAGLPVVKEHFHYVIVAIIVISIMPAIFEYWRARGEQSY